ncbi:MAG: class I SAM-dependent methyltransferase [Ignavibacteriae bacterium]|nr:MAG: class I SAM-dependent methyltransferase [Ignavibacteriota bacterium]
MTEDFLLNTKSSFDKIAEKYDERDNANEILQWMRGIVHNVYIQNFYESENILELNCGTGEDALFFASQGMKVFATDLSPEMVKIAQNKAINAGFDDVIETKALSFNEINLVDRKDFNGIVSNFGGLNCINDFNNLEKDLAEKLIPGGKFIAVVMNKFCPWEIFYYTLRLDFKNAFRRFTKKGIEANLSGENVITFYYFPKEFGKRFSNQFEVEKIYSLGVFTPPPYLIGIYRRFKPIVKIFMTIDKAIKNIFPFNRIGDHFIIVMRKIS